MFTSGQFKIAVVGKQFGFYIVTNAKAKLAQIQNYCVGNHIQNGGRR